MKVLVTGAGGFLGTETAKSLRDAGFEVVGAGRKEQVGLLVCDIGNPQHLWQLLESERPDAIVNSAAMADWSEGALSRIYPVNTVAPAIMAEWCRENHKYLLQVSGTLIHGVRVEFANIDEPEAPDTDYGHSKLLAEKVVRASGATAGIVRFGGIFGANGPDHLWLNRSIRGAIAGQPPTVVASGKALRNYIHVADAAKILAYCVTERVEGIRYAGGAENLSIRQMLEQICSIYLPRVSPVSIPGDEASDQLVATSPDLPVARGFTEALKLDL